MTDPGRTHNEHALCFTIPGLPVAQPRHRVAVVAGHARQYEAKKEHPIHTFKALARQVASESLGGPGDCRFWSSPLRLSVQFVFPRPKRLNRKRDPDYRLPMVGTPDVDNLLKAVLDALSSVVWEDDRQVYQVSDLSKWYAARGETPRTEVMVWREAGA